MMLLACTLALAAPTASTLGGTAPAVPFPPRSASAPTGTAFAAQVAKLSDSERYAATRDELLSGNVPSFLRDLVPVELHDASTSGRTVTVFVTPDYLSVGADEDYLPVPLDFVDAAEVARALGFALPTRRIVDAVYAAAAFRVAPAPLPAGPDMRSVPYILEHRSLIEAERGTRVPSDLSVGTHKDLVLTPRLSTMPDREAIYGWHRLDGKPIQPLSLVHGIHYADYSHGIRLVADTVLVDGVPRSYFEVLADPELASMLSDEGPIPQAQALMETAARAGG